MLIFSKRLHHSLYGFITTTTIIIVVIITTTIIITTLVDTVIMSSRSTRPISGAADASLVPPNLPTPAASKTASSGRTRRERPEAARENTRRSRQPHTEPESMDVDLPEDDSSNADVDSLGSEAGRDEGPAGGQPVGSAQEAENDDLSEVSVDIDLDEGDIVFKYPPEYDVQALESARELTDKEKILVAHFDGLPETLKNVAMRQKWIKKHYPSIAMEDCRSSIEEVRYEEFWTEDDEQNMLDDWQDDPLAAQLEKLNIRKNRDILTMWKVMRRFLGCFPTDIICHRNFLKYHLTFETEDGVSMENPNWTKTFCRRLARLGLHGVFNLDPSLLTLALQYVVICRTDYRGPIPWINQGTDRFIELFLFKMQEQDGSKSVVRIHREVLAHFASQRKYPTSYMSDLFRCIEKRAYKRGQCRRPRQDTACVFEITTEDLATLTRAVHAVRSAGVPSFLTLPIASRIVNYAKQSIDAPKDLENLNELRSSLILRDRRCKIVEDRRRAAGHASPAYDDAPGSISNRGRKRGRQADQSSVSESEPRSGLASPGAPQRPLSKRRRRNKESEVSRRPGDEEEPNADTLKTRLPGILARIATETNLSKEKLAAVSAILEDEFSPGSRPIRVSPGQLSFQDVHGSPGNLDNPTGGDDLSMGNDDNYSDQGPVFQDSSPRGSIDSIPDVAGGDATGRGSIVPRSSSSISAASPHASEVPPGAGISSTTEQETSRTNHPRDPWPASAYTVREPSPTFEGLLPVKRRDFKRGLSFEGHKPLRAPVRARDTFTRRENSPEVDAHSPREGKISGRDLSWEKPKRPPAFIPAALFDGPMESDLKDPKSSRDPQALERLLKSCDAWVTGRQSQPRPWERYPDDDDDDDDEDESSVNDSEDDYDDDSEEETTDE
ncbi:hypothetical protein M434DRAFT_10516 [Hypoxylon sp. CO27-5]|nr:hypothetical protein M434DRAFT_10516 [Hypoxylon sp. CO27-5]